MRIARFTYEDTPMFGVVHGSDDDPQIAVIKGDPLYQGIETTGQTVMLKDVRLLAPVIPRSKVVGVGKNYPAHAQEQGCEAPKTPLIFFKPNTSVIGNGDPIRYPSYSKQVSYEGELAIVISRMCKDVPKERVKDVIFGFTCANDLTARDVMDCDVQWTRAKGFDGACPLGPWIETELEDPDNVEIHTYVDGTLVQEGKSKEMVHNIAEIVSFVTSVCTLLPGDVIITGSPAGIGKLESGQEVEVEIEGIGVLRNPVM
ncbi:MAG: fumarylacetoacetate hydrolase family protein [Micrococcaceae bacterium]